MTWRLTFRRSRWGIAMQTFNSKIKIISAQLLQQCPTKQPINRGKWTRLVSQAFPRKRNHRKKVTNRPYPCLWSPRLTHSTTTIAIALVPVSAVAEIVWEAAAPTRLCWRQATRFYSTTIYDRLRFTWTMSRSKNLSRLKRWRADWTRLQASSGSRSLTRMKGLMRTS